MTTITSVSEPSSKSEVVSRLTLSPSRIAKTKRRRSASTDRPLYTLQPSPCRRVSTGPLSRRARMPSNRISPRPRSRRRRTRRGRSLSILSRGPSLRCSSSRGPWGRSRWWTWHTALPPPLMPRMPTARRVRRRPPRAIPPPTRSNPPSFPQASPFLRSSAPNAGRTHTCMRTSPPPHRGRRDPPWCSATRSLVSVESVRR
mmetsp:Transcript_23058/g.68012  ORF Transcript_23058/g.68012 Transcript_23058/m.68012 type:complete len:201 (+) Transcript_23058:1867-2469(+)